MNTKWHDSAPIYLQLKERVIGMILDGDLKPGDALPSIRQVASDLKLNHMTILRAYQELVDDDLVEKRRGIGMYIADGASAKLMSSERERFLNEEWPAVIKRIARLGLDINKLLRDTREGVTE